MTKLIFATHNPGKVIEMKALLGGIDIKIVSMDDAGVHEDVLEDGKTFEENARRKAQFVLTRTGEWSLAEDSGLCIEALGCAPGIHSARWAGEGASEDQMIQYTLKKMENIPEEKRGAWFETALVLVAPDGRQWTFHGKVEGQIATVPRGINRPQLPYDMIFIPEGRNQTFAEMSDTEKNSLSHRGRAFVKLKEFLRTL